MTAFIDRRGQRFGSLVVEEQDFKRGGRVRWICRCDCGRAMSALADNLIANLTRECGYHKSSVRAKTMIEKRAEAEAAE